MNKKNTKKRQWVTLGIVAAVFVVLIAGILLLSKLGIFKNHGENGGSQGTVVSEEEQSAIVEGIEVADGALSVDEVLTQASGYEEIYERLAGHYETLYAEESWTDVPMEDEPESLEDMEAYKGEVYDMTKVISFTDVPEHETASGSVCKTDDHYAYLVRNDGFVRIMKIDGGSMEHMSLISEFLHEMEFVQDLHVVEDRMILITSYTEILDEALGLYREGTVIYTYDIADRQYPILKGSIETEGFYMGSRIMGTDVYVYSSCHKDGFLAADGSLMPVEGLETSSYVPSVNGQVLSAESVYMPTGVSDSAYFVAVSLNLEDPASVKDAKAFLSVESQYEAGEDGIYLTLKNGLYNVKDSILIRVDFAEGRITPVYAGAVEGYIMGAMFISEQSDQIRVISTGDSGNYLYIMDKQFQILSKKDDLASGEQIQAARFFADKLYLAAYGEKPITAVELSDPSSVTEYEIEKIPGFEGALYEIGEDQILGITYILNEETLAYEGVRLSVFDVSDMAKIQVLHTTQISTDTTPAISDVTGLYLDTEKGLIGFATEDWDDTYTNVDNFYHLFEYTEQNGFRKLLETRLGAGSCWYARGFALGDSFYVAEQDSGTARSFDMANGYDQTGEMYY